MNSDSNTGVFNCGIKELSKGPGLVLYKLTRVSILHCAISSVGYHVSCRLPKKSSTAALMENQEVNKRKLDTKLKKLEKDAATMHEDAMERALKRAKQDRSLEFKQKGHQEQYEFNKEVEDHLEEEDHSTGQ